MAKAENAEAYIEAHEKWKDELVILRSFLKSFPFEEAIKWGAPVYTYKGKNLIGLAAFKKHYGLWFFDGSQLQENTAFLHNAQEGKTKTLRQIRFSKETVLNIPALRPYVQEAIQLIDQGNISKPDLSKTVKMTQEFEERLKKEQDLETEFSNLSPGKQREYISYIQEATRLETKEKRFEKIIPLIRDGKGLNDKYKK
ncbi:YdeI/OmpD-associated family protein [Antarcticibacterium sp. 1MA-6-2]|uniref:YdeI/OmpD-associated family protein n=1 Tax=Antarcticibacterium sp. 1MA-6-2 TaxID=2908210 RepID=UPI001F3F1D70|nr:DUF1801 domain-containing protein [Antarcticibacterium sp. 1MA-6-2]UJH91139.1 YdeI/OmpD-associated family protein [Antarcticibacterium sp. 1MA-6-2]